MATDEYRAINVFDGKYEVNAFGDVRRADTHKSIQGFINGKGYRQLNLRHNEKRVYPLLHRVVADAFIGSAPTPEHQVNHIDGDKLNNAVTNLEWVTPSQNQAHAYEHELRNAKGEKNARAKLTWAQVCSIRKSMKAGIQLAEEYSVTPSLISQIRRNKIWQVPA